MPSRVENGNGTIARPPGLRIDTGGSTKGLVADAAAQRLAGARRLVVDCGGDLRVLVAPGAAPFDVVVEHPLTREPAATLRVRGGGVATSGLARRLWRGEDGRFAHHLLDPATGAPAWTGLISATALAATALEAELLAKTALLQGPAGARRVLAGSGGVLVHDDGAVERVDAAARPVLRLSRSALLGLSFYVRRRVGARRWRKLHRYTVLVYPLGVIHTLGAGSDAEAPWLRAVLLATGAPILFLFLLRVLPAEDARPTPASRPETS